MIMSDLDMLYDYYKDNNLGASGFAAVASRVKDDKVEKLFRILAQQAMDESKSAAEEILKLGGKIY